MDCLSKSKSSRVPNLCVAHIGVVFEHILWGKRQDLYFALQGPLVAAQRAKELTNKPSSGRISHRTLITGPSPGVTGKAGGSKPPLPPCKGGTTKGAEGMAASPHANSSPYRSNGSGSLNFRWLALTLVLLLGVTGILLRRSARPSLRHRFAQDFYANIKAEALPMVQGEARRGQTPVEEQMWLKLHETYLAEVARFQKTGADLVFYGDSITEAFRGTTMGLPNDKHAATPAILQKHYGHLRTAALSLAGDTTLNLLWRVQNGEGPTFSPKIAVVLIGTNDLTNPLYQLDINNPEATGAIVAAGATSAVRAMLEQNMRMHVLLLAIMPRGERFVFASFADKYKQPSKQSPAIAATNAHLRRFAESNDRVTYVDCNAVLLEEDGTGGLQIAYELMPDSLHPNALGMDVFLDCLDHHLKPWLPLKTLN